MIYDKLNLNEEFKGPSDEEIWDIEECLDYDDD